MNIIKPNISWRSKLTPINRSNIDGIALHHMAHKTWDFQKTHEYHRNTLGWIGIGYNWWIGFDGKIYEGRGFNMGAGVEKHNSHLYSIGFQGDFDTQTMTAEQLKSGAELIAWLIKQVPSIKIVDQHKRWNNTSCAGKNFPYQRMMDEVKKVDNKPDWKVEGLKGLHQNGLLQDYDGWYKKLDEPIPSWAVFVILYRIFKALRK